MPELFIDSPLELCPRRVQEFGDTSMFNLPQTDKWKEDRTCSWCGSMSPEYLFEAIEAGLEIGPTDKNYKIYINPRNISIFAFDLPKGAPKFYFQHFSKEQCIKFIQLSNDNKLKLGYPGYFYVLPFFMQEVPHNSDNVTNVTNANKTNKTPEEE